MEFTTFQFTWANFWLAALSLSVLYIVLQFMARIIGEMNFLGKSQTIVSNIIRHILLIYEPMVLLLLASIFVLINPIFHGLIMGLLLLIGFRQLKDYANGRVIQFDNTIAVGKRLSSQNLTGMISKMTRLGLYLKTSKGLQFISYSNLYSNGFQLLSGSEIGGFYQLHIAPMTSNEKTNYQIYLTDLLATAPYLDRNHQTEILPSAEHTNHFKAKISVKEEPHLYDLIALIEEWGFNCRIV